MQEHRHSFEDNELLRHIGPLTLGNSDVTALFHVFFFVETQQL